MRSGSIWGLVLAGLCLSTPAVGIADAPVSPKSEPKAGSTRPTVQLRLAPLDDLIGDLRYVVKKIGREEEGKQFEELLKSRTGPNGLEGIDTKKPIGLVGTIAKQLDKSELLFLLPIADEKTFLAFLDNLDYKVKKDKDGLYTLRTENIPLPILFRFANGYLYAALKFTSATTIVSADALPKPETAFAGGSGVLSLAVNLDALPPSVRKAAVPAAALYLGNLKDRELPPGTTDKQKELRDGLIDEVMRIGKLLIDDGATLRLGIDLDRKSDAFAMGVQVSGPKGSGLAKEITALTGRTSLGPALLSKDSMMGGYLNVPIPARVRKLLDPVIDELFEMGLKDTDKNARTLLDPLVTAVQPTLKADTLTVAADIRGPGKDGKYTMAVYQRVRKGDALEKAAKDLFARVPEEGRSGIKINVAKAGDTQIHEIDVKSVAESTKKMFGTGPMYLTMQEKAFLMTGGPSALNTIKTLASAKPAAGKLIGLYLSTRRLADFMEKNEKKGAKELAEQSFADNSGDKVSLTLDGGNKLDLRLSVDLAVLKFAYLLGEADKKKEKD